VDLALDFLDDRLELGLAGEALGLQEFRHPCDRIALRLRGALVRRLVQTLVVGQRMRVRPDHLGVDEGRPLAGAGVGDGFLYRGVARQVVRAVNALNQQPREVRYQPRDVAAGRLCFDGHRDRVAVVFDDDDDRQPAQAGVVERFPELSFAGGAIAEREVGDLVGVVPLVTVFDGRELLVEPARLRAADCLQALGTGGTGLRHDVQRRVSPVRRHLPAARGRIVLGADGGEQHLERGHPEGEAEGAIAIVRVEPVVSGAEGNTGSGDDGLVAGAADLEEDQALTLELDFLVIELPGQHHRPVGSKQFVAGQAVCGHTLAVADCRPFHARSVPFAPRVARGTGGLPARVQARL
jgi:hypothetical protein